MEDISDQNPSKKDFKLPLFFILAGIAFIIFGLFSYNRPSSDSDSITYKKFNIDTAAALEEKPVDLNTASLEDLIALPGIGEVTATKIINARPFSSVDELLAKKIVGKSVLAKIKDLVKVE